MIKHHNSFLSVFLCKLMFCIAIPLTKYVNYNAKRFIRNQVGKVLFKSVSENKLNKIIF